MNAYLRDLYLEFEKIDLEFINDCAQTIGVLQRIKETPNSDNEFHMARYLIDANMLDIKQIREDLEYVRSQIERFS